MLFEESIVINRPPEEVWAFMTDLFNSPRMRPGFLGWRTDQPGPLGAGSTMQGRAVILGIETRIKARVAEWDPPRSWVITMTGRPMRSYIDRVTLERIGAAATRVVRSTEVDPHPAMNLLRLVYAPLFRRQQRTVFENAKRLLESRAPTSPYPPSD